MENAINVSLTPIQLYISLAIQIWLVVVFPVIVIRKLNHLSELLEGRDSADQDS
ncbi:MAG TPA: hypothetical protein PL155_06395 [Candidatus Omnitrophota bacterium]|nr:hypothetical protein [Candidatus Omnitrophota bacterium]HPD83892.1 hypothetical protein [Candidatus Omnitrophota bacterium]HRZ02749.1 hypothetical protein [Candidatus Omnitrophota bacterium]